MATECCWPFCGAGPKECDCADNVKKEVMQIDSNRKADCESGTVAPPPVSEAGGDHLCTLGRFSSWRDCPEHSGNMHTKHVEMNTSAGTCIDSVPLPNQIGTARIGMADGPDLIEPTCLIRDAIAYGEGRERAAFARASELEAALEREKEAMFAALSLIADIRKAAGDPMGKLMQSELVELIARQREECDKAKEVEESDFESMEMYRRARDRADRITAAARAVVDRWETPLWKDAPATAGFIYALRDAISAGGGDD